MNVFIFDSTRLINDRRELFILSRPFFCANQWKINEQNLSQYKINIDEYKLVDDINLAHFVIIPFAVNVYFNQKKINELNILNEKCIEKNIRAYGFISGDFGSKYTHFSNIIYFRASGFKSKLSKNNKGFPIALSDHFQIIFNKNTIEPSQKSTKPIVGFCGHATLSFSKRIKEIAKFSLENAKRFLKNPFGKNYEVLFASAYERAKILQYLQQSKAIQTNFILRNQYRAGAKNAQQREQTTIQYYNNILQSDYIVCLRGAGNFSVRLYETLMMGKIPIFINTDCILPFEDTINWKNHVVWIEWKDRKNIAQCVENFHKSLSNEQFIAMQINNRKLWKETLSVQNMLKTIREIQ